MTLAYVFWHRARDGVDVVEYEDALRGFHARLADANVAGLSTSWSVRVDELPWLGGAPGYEDRYLVADFASLGLLNEAAVAPRMRPTHDAAAQLAGDGIAGIYAVVRGGPDPQASRARWFGKPAGTSYQEFLAGCEVGADETLWQRQLTLGPTPEFQLTGRRSAEMPPAAKYVELTPL